MAGDPAWALRAQRAALGPRRSQRRPHRAGGSPHGLAGVGEPRAAAELAPVGVGEAGPVAAADVQVAVRPEGQVPDGVRGELLAPLVGDQRLLAAGADAGRRVDGDTGQVAGDRAAVGGRPRRGGTAVAPAGRVADRVVVVGVEHVDEVAAGGPEARVDGQTQQAPVPEVLDLRAQVDDLGGVGSAGESNTLTMPPFSPTNTLPPGAKAIAVGRVSPDHTATSENPLGTAAATAGDVGAADRVARPRTSPPRSGGGAAATGAGDSSAAPKATSRANEQILRAVLRAEFPRVS